MTRPMTGAPLERVRAVKRRGEMVRGVLAGLVAAVVVAGVPVGLLTLVGNPVPGWTGGGLVAATGPVAIVARALACLVWVLWAQFVPCLLVEAVAGARGTGLPRRVPFATGAQQDLARTLVTPILLLAAPTQGLRSAPPPATVSPPAPVPVGPASLPVGAPGRGTGPSPVAVPPAAIPSADVAPPPGSLPPPTTTTATLPSPHPVVRSRSELRDIQRGGRSPVVAWDIADAELLATGLADALARLRSHHMGHRRPGTPVVLPDAEAASVEAAARLGADPAEAAFLDRGLRMLAHRLAEDAAPVPEIYAARLAADRLELFLTASSDPPPAPFVGGTGGGHWYLPRSVELSSVEGVPAPLPGLVSLGTDRDGRVLVDLEAAGGVVCVDGDRDAARSLVAAAALELVTSRWSDHVRVSMVGFGRALRPLAPARLRCVDTLEEIVDSLVEHVLACSRALSARGIDSVLAGRVHGLTDADCAPEFVVVADEPNPACLARLSECAQASRRVPLGILVAGPLSTARWRFTVDSSGTVRGPSVGITANAQLLSARSYAALARLLATERISSGMDGDDPAGSSGRAAAEQSRADLHRPARLGESEAPGASDSPSGSSGSSEVDRQPEAAQPHEAARHEPPRATAMGRTREPDGGAGYDRDLTERALTAPVGVGIVPVLSRPVDLDAPAGVLLRILGEPCVYSGISAPTTPDVVEICVYIALLGSARTEALAAALWPRGVAATERDALLRQAADWLGRDQGGAPRLRYVGDLLTLSDDVLLDWHLFVALVRRGRYGDVARALDLIRGPLAQPCPPRRYTWLVRGRVAHEAPPYLVDVAHRESRASLGRGDLDAAVAAAQAGLRAAPMSRVLWEDVADAVRRRDGAQAAEEVLDARLS